MAQHRTLEMLMEAEREKRQRLRDREAMAPPSKAAVEAQGVVDTKGAVVQLDQDLDACVEAHGGKLVLAIAFWVVVCFGLSSRWRDGGRREAKSERHAV